MADPAGGLTRSQSMPVLKTEEVILKKIQDQDGLISLMQTQIEFQSELIAKHDKRFEELVNKVQELTLKLKTLEEAYRKGAESKEQEAARSALWSSSIPTTSTKASSSSSSKLTEVKDKPSSLAEMVKEAAEQVLGITEGGVGGGEGSASSGFVFDDKLGLYFDQSSGYYYDPVKQLYYNGHTKTFYSYDATTNTYQVHSTANSNSVKRKKKTRKGVKKQDSQNKKVNSESVKTPLEADADAKSPSKDAENLLEDSLDDKDKPKSLSDMEEGEISSSPQTSAESSPRCSRDGGNDSSKESESCEEYSEDEDPPGSPKTSYPPCIRAVIQDSPDAPDMKKGTLFLVPYTGGTIGSSGTHHCILLESESVERNHAKIHYDQMDENGDVEGDGDDDDEENGGNGGGKYFITDLGSTNGTILNRTRLSESGEISEPKELVHGSTLQVGDVIILIHIHPGDFTCGHCEPGLILEKEPLYEYTPPTGNWEVGETARRSEMKKIKKKYGLDRRNVGVPVTDKPKDSKYVDRAKSRRVKIGSDNPFAKTEVASTNTPIRESNKGFKMLQKMGWKGKGLGKEENQGIKEPINCEVKADRLGFGLESSSENSSGHPLSIPPVPIPFRMSYGKGTSKSQKRLERLTKTVQRFNEAQQQ